MNEFLEELESKIVILDEKERKKVIRKYQRQIEVKIKEGKSEKEAIEELGNTDDISKEICDEYHINLSNCKKTFKDKVNEGIEESAKFLANTCEEIIEQSKVATKDKFLVTFFEILLKIIILVMLFLLAKIPFILVDMGLEFVFDLLFYPFNATLGEIFDYIIVVLYGSVCIAFSVFMFKGYFAKSSDKENEGNIETENKKQVSSRKINYAIGIIKILIMVIVIIPMIFLNISFLALTVLAIFLIFKGISVSGLAIILLSFFLLTLIMTIYVSDAMDNRNRNHLFVLCISVLSLVIGIVLFVDDLMGYKYPKTLDNSHFETKTESLTVEIDKVTDFIILDAEVEEIIDNNIKDNTILIEVTYYDDFVDIALQEITDEEMDSIIITSENDDLNIDDYILMYNNMLEDLKENNIFNYTKLDNYKVVIYCNEKTKELVR